MCEAAFSCLYCPSTSLRTPKGNDLYYCSGKCLDRHCARAPHMRSVATVPSAPIVVRAQCPVCMNEGPDGKGAAVGAADPEKNTALSCINGHITCTSCVDQIKSASGTQTCPLCRAPMCIKTEEDMSNAIAVSKTDRDAAPLMCALLATVFKYQCRMPFIDVQLAERFCVLQSDVVHAINVLVAAGAYAFVTWDWASCQIRDHGVAYANVGNRRVPVKTELEAVALAASGGDVSSAEQMMSIGLLHGRLCESYGWELRAAFAGSLPCAVRVIRRVDVPLCTRFALFEQMATHRYASSVCWGPQSTWWKALSREAVETACAVGADDAVAGWALNGSAAAYRSGVAFFLSRMERGPSKRLTEVVNVWISTAWSCPERILSDMTLLSWVPSGRRRLSAGPVYSYEQVVLMMMLYGALTLGCEFFAMALAKLMLYLYASSRGNRLQSGYRLAARYTFLTVAKELFRKLAVELNNAEAAYHFGMLCSHYPELPLDLRTALTFFRRAHRGGIREAADKCTRLPPETHFRCAACKGVMPDSELSKRQQARPYYATRCKMCVRRSRKVSSSYNKTFIRRSRTLVRFINSPLPEAETTVFQETLRAIVSVEDVRPSLRRAFGVPVG